jgi:hypothetical protein
MDHNAIDFKLIGQQLGRLSWRFFLWIFLIECGFALIYVVQTPSITINRLFDLDDESTLPMWFSSMQLMLLSLMTLLTWKLDNSTNWRRAVWLCVAGLFGFLSADEAAIIHESFGAAATKQFDWSIWGDHFWLLVFFPFAIIAVISLLGVIWQKLRADKLAFVLALAALLAWVSALGLETLEKWMIHRHVAALELIPRAEVVSEELMEMAGATLFLAAIVRWIRWQTSEDRSPVQKEHTTRNDN